MHFLIAFVLFVSPFASAKKESFFETMIRGCKQNHGCTYNWKHLKDLTGQPAYVLSTFKDKEEKHPDITWPLLRQYTAKHRLLLNSDKYALGLWEDDGDYYFDVVTLIPQIKGHPEKALRRAVACARKYEQKAIYDLKKRENIEIADTKIKTEPRDCDL